MPTLEQHTIQAEHNEEMLKFMTQQKQQAYFSDWCITIAFYTALHSFEAVIAANKPTIRSGVTNAAVEHSPSHYARNEIMKSLFNNIHRPYAALYRMSRIARYDCHAPNSHNWADAEVFLGDVKNECGKLIT